MLVRPQKIELILLYYFARYEHDFGTIYFKKPVAYHFQFVNSGQSNLVINNIRTTCGCTIVEWTETPIKPGKLGIINIQYDAISLGIFYEEIGVYYYGSDSPIILKIKGKVVYPNE